MAILKWWNILKITCNPFSTFIIFKIDPKFALDFVSLGKFGNILLKHYKKSTIHDLKTKVSIQGWFKHVVCRFIKYWDFLFQKIFQI